MGASEWLFPAGTFTVPREMFVGVHPWAGTSTWATLLGGTDHGPVFPEAGAVIAVCRATPAGLNTTKALIGSHGLDRVRAVLVVADAPGRALPAAVRGIKVLSSVVPVVEVPWMVKLRGLENPQAVAAAIAKPVRRVRDRLAEARVRVPRGVVETTRGNDQ